MDRERWNRIESIFQSIVDLPAEQQEAALRQACGDDEDLIQQVRALIAADEKPHSILQGVAVDAFALSEQENWEGKKIGVYRVVRRIGEGGMGVVLLAERADGQFQQQVAIKLVKRGMDSEEIVKRFQRERQILARLQHPNIAMLLGGGVIEDGRPYFVMEYVSGAPIDDYCEEQGLDVNQRLRLFLKVCETVAFAQRNLVVHRDLKPSNILVGGDGAIKLLDFGIAKVLSSDSDAHELQALTRTGMRIMTPEYASPEQLVGDPVTTASDVYSLGVILFQLLTGNTPFRSAKLRPIPLTDVAAIPDPEKPSQHILRKSAPETSVTRPQDFSGKMKDHRRVDSRQLARQLSGDLDNICLKALRREPERRYHSAEQLQDDIIRYLAGRPVTAQADSFSYRASKFIKRNRRSVVASTFIFFVMLSLIAYYTIRLSQERDRAQVEALKAQGVSDFLIEIFNVSDPSASRGRSVSARELLDSGAARVTAELSDQPETQAQMLHVLGRVYFELALYDEALNLAQRAHGIWRSLLGERSNEVAVSLQLIGQIEYERGDYDSSEVHSRRALEIRVEQVGEDDTLAAEIKTDLGRVLRHLGRIDEAETLLRESLATRRRIFGNVHEDIAHSANHLGRLLWTKREFAAAEPLLREAVDVTVKIRGEYHVESGAAMGALAALLVDMEQLDAGESLYVRARNVVARLVGENHAYVAGLSGSLADLAYRKGDYARSDSIYRQVWRVFRDYFPESHPYLATPPAGIGKNFMAINRPDSALVYFEEALTVRRQSLGADHWQTGMSMVAVGDCLRWLDRFDEAEPLLIKGHSLVDGQFGAEDERTLSAVQALIDLYQDWGKPQKAEEFECLLRM